MKYLSLIAAIFLVGCGPLPETPAPAKVAEVKVAGPDGCIVDTSSKLVNEHQVGKITNLVQDKKEGGLNGQCTVSFDITVNGQQYHLEQTEIGWEQLDSLCYYARERARKDLLLDLGGDFKSESVVSCQQRDT